MGLLTTLKGIPLAYNKDMQEDKEAVFDAYDTIKICMITLDKMVATMTINAGPMKKAAAGGFSNATDAADWLVKHGMPFRDAHAVIGKLVFYALENHKALDELTLDEYHAVDPIFDESIYEAIDLKTCVDQRAIIGGPAKATVEAAIATNRNWFETK